MKLRILFLQMMQRLLRMVNWKFIYTLPFKSTNDSKLREFQYKYIMRIIPTNKYLFNLNVT